MDKKYGRPILCEICEKGGGTLVKTLTGYRHADCLKEKRIILPSGFEVITSQMSPKKGRSKPSNES